MTDADDLGDDELRVARSPLVRFALIVVGTVSVVLGVVGIALPVLPTTPFLLLAAACYARSSERLHRWLLTNRWFGQYIRDWRAGKGIPLRGKILALVMLAAGIGSSIAFFVPLWWAKVLLAAIGLAVATYIVRVPTRR